ncbi:MAG TPA: hypothetical protein VGD65_12360 [Chryseosolibacter sp.]
MQPSTLESATWTTAEKVNFRFLFVFFILFIIVENNGAFPFFEILMHYPTEGLHAFVVWLGKNVLHLPYDIVHFTYGSGDTTYDYILVLCCFVVAAASTIIWSILDRSSAGYPTLYYWLTVIVRFYVGLMLIGYGMVKIFKLQFPEPYLYRLMQPYGESSPMGLAWTFLGFSKGYNYFMGFAEVAAGLLLFRRTMTFGAILCMMTAANVMAINYFYDVPVKILSTALFVLSFFLLSRDLRRLVLFFFSGKQISLPEIAYPYAANRKLNIARIVLKTSIIGNVLVNSIIQGIQAEKQYGDSVPKPKLWGVYKAETFVLGTDTIPPLITDTLHWKKLVIEGLNHAHICYLNDSVVYYRTEIDTTKQFMKLSMGEIEYKLNYTQQDSVNFRVEGLLQRDSVFITMRKVKSRPEDFLLMGRGFHWINETPYNR